MSEIKKITCAATFEVHDDINKLPITYRPLVEAAQSACTKAYAPYSNFHVGAAVQLENGEIITGNNQENAAYPSGLCAERVAFFYAASQFPNTIIKSIALTYDSLNIDNKEPITPCGACRQAMLEYEIKQNKPIQFITFAKSGKTIVGESIASLLPLSFSSAQLNK